METHLSQAATGGICFLLAVPTGGGFQKFVVCKEGVGLGRTFRMGGSPVQMTETLSLLSSF